MSTTLKNFGFAFTLAIGAVLTGCAADSPANPPGGSTTGSGDNTGGDDAPHAMDATGKYKVQSTFDIASNMPGTVGVVVNDFIAATDDPDDPTHWVLDQIIAQMPNGTLKSLLSGAEPFVAGYLNDQLLNIAPDFVTTILAVGNDFGDMAKHFGLNETLDVAKAGNDYTSVVTAFGVHFNINGNQTDLNFADYQIANIVDNNVGVQLDATGKLSIAEHKMPISYGKILRVGLDAVIIPAIDPNASNLQQLLANHIDCAAVGQAINDALTQQFGFGGGAGTWTSACTAGLNYGAQTIYSKISDIDSSALEFDLTGTAKAVDTNHDYKADALQTGKWTGTLSYAGTPAPLAAATFTGARM
ncbi:MAG: hypothetical protein JO257_28585 [Deltaproteobacteria bacterium]|nr:hypothetical protein [Deltaproteobacteria bacterium]